ncbi:MAG: gliding motility lipoprotein GldH [Bacteroidales bacterium]|nr:MAG: gliding motility lipoprotein GldH [Bacteroidales bacterium]
MQNKNILNFTGLLIIICLSLLSCDKNRVFDQNVKIPAGVWNKENVIKFNINISDTASSHNIYINLRNGSKYQYSNIFMFITTHAPNGVSVKDTFEITLADVRGKWLGRGVGNAMSNQVLYLRNIRFPYRGIYVFDIEQAMWNAELTQILDVGLRVEKNIN